MGPWAVCLCGPRAPAFLFLLLGRRRAPKPPPPAVLQSPTWGNPPPKKKDSGGSSKSIALRPCSILGLASAPARRRRKKRREKKAVSVLLAPRGGALFRTLWPRALCPALPCAPVGAFRSRLPRTLWPRSLSPRCSSGSRARALPPRLPHRWTLWPCALSGRAGRLPRLSADALAAVCPLCSSRRRAGTLVSFLRRRSGRSVSISPRSSIRRSGELRC